MARKLKATGCTRIILFLIIAAPVAYIAASYINGNDGIESFKSLLGFGTEQNDIPQRDSNQTGDLENCQNQVKSLEEALKQKEQEIKYWKQLANPENQ